MALPNFGDLHLKRLEDIENNVRKFMVLQFEHNNFFRNELKEQKSFNALIEEKLSKIDELARNVDKISLDVDSWKIRSIPPKHDINESLKAMRISIDECKERTIRMRAKKDCFVKADRKSVV